MADSVAGIARAVALPPRYYLGADMLAQDQRRVMAPSWQLVAHREQLAGAGDHVVTEIAGVPVVLVRDEAGTLRALANVCRHRAGPLALENGRGAKALRCKYHGWTYALDGQLKRAPEMREAEGFDPKSLCLPRFRVAEWQGLVFACLSPAAPPFEEVYAGIAERIRPVDFSAMRHVHRDVYEVGCNWKVYCDNYLEGYHLPYVHPALTQALDYKDYRAGVERWYAWQRSPLGENDGVYGEGEAWYFWIWPNTMLNVMPGRLQANRILPLGPDRCRAVFDYYYAQDAAALARVEKDRAFSDRVQHEDGAICESVQKALASGYYEPGRLCPRHEAGVWHFHRLLEAAYGGAVPEAG